MKCPGAGEFSESECFGKQPKAIRFLAEHSRTGDESMASTGDQELVQKALVLIFGAHIGQQLSSASSSMGWPGTKTRAAGSNPCCACLFFPVHKNKPDHSQLIEHHKHQNRRSS